MFRFISDCWDTVCENPVSAIFTAAATAGAGALGVAFAPAIAAGLGVTGILGAASTGTAISGLSGGALVNASLAALGGGALSAGGGGVAAGTAAIGSFGSRAGCLAAKLALRSMENQNMRRRSPLIRKGSPFNGFAWLIGRPGQTKSEMTEAKNNAVLSNRLLPALENFSIHLLLTCVILTSYICYFN